MPVEILASSEATKRLRSRTARWPDGRSSEARLEGAAKVALTPSFSFSTSDQIFTIGSCFAREIENHMSSRGFQLPALSIEIPREERNSEAGNDILNKYSVHSMENEIRWAFEGSPAPQDFYLKVGEDLWHDAQMAPNLNPATLERVIERRAMVSTLFRKLPDCRVVVLTLGLAEAWFDTKTNLYLNGIPPQFALSADSSRFQLHILSHDDIVESLERIHALLSKYGHADFKMLLTVSPVPFKATFSGNDALVANTYSKSVQRAAAETFVRRHLQVDYFPSYEMVTLTDRKAAYELDNIHVTRPMVGHIMQTVTTAYANDAEAAEPGALPALEVAKTRTAPSTKAAILYKAQVAMKDRNYEEAVTFYTSLLYRFGSAMDSETMFDTRLDLGVAMLRAKLTKAGLTELREAKKLQPNHPRATYKLGLAYARLKMDQEALEMFKEAARLNPAEPDHHWRLGVQLIRMGQQGAGLVSASKALELKPGHTGALEILQAQEGALNEARLTETTPKKLTFARRIRRMIRAFRHSV